MADNIVHNHTPKSETEKQGLFDIFRKKDDENEDKSDGLLAKLHISDSNPSMSDEEGKKKEKTIKEKAEEKFEEDKVKMNLKIIQGSEAAFNLKQKATETIGGKVVGDDDIKPKIGEKKEEEEAKENEEKKVVHEQVVMQPPDEKKKVENEEKKVMHEQVVMQPPDESTCEDKVHGGDTKGEDGHTAAPPPTQPVAAAKAESEHKEEKKGILEKIKEKLPGFSSKSEDEIKKEKE